MKKSTITRRDFIGKATTAIGGTTIAMAFPNIMHGHVAPSDKINVGLIGGHWQGTSNLYSMLKIKGVECVALCDIDESVLKGRMLKATANQKRKPKLYKDYRKLLEDKNVDVVIIGTPDHWHCLQLIDACQAGKDVYLEKPIANSIQECNIMVKAVEKYDRIVQVGQWQRSEPHFQEAIKFIQSGKLGKINMTKTWNYGGGYRSNWFELKATPEVVKDKDIPKNVNYKMWLGPAPLRAFNQNRFHVNWRWFWDYAGGLMTDWGVHLIDIILAAMSVEAPKSIAASGGKFLNPNSANETPDTLQAIYEYDNFSMLWENCNIDDIRFIKDMSFGMGHGISFIGTEGKVTLNRGGWEINAYASHSNEKIVEKQSFPRQETTNGLDLHTQNFIAAVRDKKRENLNADIKVGYMAAVNSHMGNIAYRTNKKLYWDREQKNFDDNIANQYITPTYHNGWELPSL